MHISGKFSDVSISQGSIVMHLCCGEVFIDPIIPHLPGECASEKKLKLVIVVGCLVITLLQICCSERILKTVTI